MDHGETGEPPRDRRGLATERLKVLEVADHPVRGRRQADPALFPRECSVAGEIGSERLDRVRRARFERLAIGEFVECGFGTEQVGKQPGKLRDPVGRASAPALRDRARAGRLDRDDLARGSGRWSGAVLKLWTGHSPAISPDFGHVTIDSVRLSIVHKIDYTSGCQANSSSLYILELQPSQPAPNDQSRPPRYCHHR